MFGGESMMHILILYLLHDLYRCMLINLLLCAKNLKRSEKMELLIKKCEKLWSCRVNTSWVFIDFGPQCVINLSRIKIKKINDIRINEFRVVHKFHLNSETISALLSPFQKTCRLKMLNFESDEFLDSVICIMFLECITTFKNREGH